MECTSKIVAYYRVSTKRQGQSGLGLEAQKRVVADHVRATRGQIIGEFVEVETGKASDRSKLTEAIATARMCGAILVIAKLDRLARNMKFIATLMDSGVEFVCCDNPHANRLTIHILAAVAEDEAQRISERTRAALEAAKQRGVLLGSQRPNHWLGREDRRLEGSHKACKKSAEKRSAKAKEYAMYLQGKIGELGEGLSLDQIAEKLNALGYTSPRGKRITKSTISKVLARVA